MLIRSSRAILLLAAVLVIFTPVSIPAQEAPPRDETPFRAFDLLIYEEKPMFASDVISPSLTQAVEPLREMIDAPGLFDAVFFIVDFRRVIDLLGCEEDMRDYLVTARNLDIGPESSPAKSNTSLEPCLAFDLQNYDSETVSKKLSDVTKDNEVYSFSEKCSFIIMDGTFIFAPSPEYLRRDTAGLLVELKQQQSLLSERYQHYGYIANRRGLKELLQKQVHKSFLVGLDRCLEATLSIELSGNDTTGLYQLAATTTSEADATILQRLLHGYNDLWLAHHLACSRSHEESNREIYNLFAPLGRIVQDLRFASDGASATVSLPNADEHMDDLKEQQCMLNKMTVGEAAKRYIYAEPENKDLVMDKLLEAGLPVSKARCPVDNKLFTIKPIHTEVEQRGFLGSIDPYGHKGIELEVICPTHGALKP